MEVSPRRRVIARVGAKTQRVGGVAQDADHGGMLNPKDIGTQHIERTIGSRNE